MQKIERNFFIDNIKIVLTILVILHHLGITYGAQGTWYYVEGGDFITGLILTIMVVVNQTFFMGFFFFWAAYFIAPSFENKKTSRFLVHRILRLGLPWIVFFLFSPTHVYWEALRLGQTVPGYFEFMWDSYINFKYLDPNHLWFVEALLIFTLLFVIFKKTAGNFQFLKKEFPSNRTIVLFNIIVGLVTFFLRIFVKVGDKVIYLWFSFFPQYVALFIAGLYAFKNNWIDQIRDKTASFWFRISLVSIFIIFPTLFILGGALSGQTEPFLGGFTWQSMAWSLWEPFVCIGLCLKLIVVFRNKHNKETKLNQMMSRNAYAVYILHSIVCVMVSYLLIPVKIYPMLKFFLSAAIAIPACFLTATLVRMIPGLKKII